MLSTLLLFAAVAALFHFFPNLMRYVIGPPLVGIPFGGFTWCVMVCIFPGLFSLASFGFFLLAGWAGGFVFMATCD